MKAELEKAKRLLSEGGYTLAMVRGETAVTSVERGVRPLINLIDAGEDMSGFCAADKVVGKAAAFMYVLLGVDCLYANVISRPALEVLKNNGITAEYTTLTGAIRNRTNTGFCPMETAVKEISEPHEALKAIREKLAQMK